MGKRGRPRKQETTAAAPKAAATPAERPPVPLAAQPEGPRPGYVHCPAKGAWLSKLVCANKQGPQCVNCDQAASGPKAPKPQGSGPQAPPQAKPAKAPKAAKEPRPVQHKDYDGKTVTVDGHKYCNRIECAICGEPRWVANADTFQVKLCKPCKRLGEKKAREAFAARQKEAAK